MLAEFGLGLDGVRLETGEGGVFAVAVDGEKIFDKKESSFDLEANTAGVASRIQN
jgi:predicted Rdx family selenoprotein